MFDYVCEECDENLLFGNVVDLEVSVVHNSFLGHMIQAFLDICISCIYGHLQNCEFIGSQSLEGSGLTVDRYFTWNFCKCFN